MIAGQQALNFAYPIPWPLDIFLSSRNILPERLPECSGLNSRIRGIRRHAFYLSVHNALALRYFTIIQKACFFRCASQHAYYLYVPYTLASGYLHIIHALSTKEAHGSRLTPSSGSRLTAHCFFKPPAPCSLPPAESHAFFQRHTE